MWKTVVGAVDVRSCCGEERGGRCKEIYMQRGMSRMRVCEGYGVCVCVFGGTRRNGCCVFILRVERAVREARCQFGVHHGVATSP
jgi:hypothetical protein